MYKLSGTVPAGIFMHTLLITGVQMLPPCCPNTTKKNFKCHFIYIGCNHFLLVLILGPGSIVHCYQLPVQHR